MAEIYYAVIFTETTSSQQDGYETMAARMHALAALQPGYIGIEHFASTSKPLESVTISYWQNLAAIQSWRNQAEHQLAQQLGREQWYRRYRVRVARVERDYCWESDKNFEEDDN